MLEAIIIDDESHCQERLAALLVNYHDRIKVVKICGTVEDGIQAVEFLKPQVLFLDIQIRDKTGFDLLEAISDKNIAVIFTTAHEEFAIQAIKYSALDYLLKPIEPELLESAIHRLSEIDSRQYQKKISTLLSNQNSGSSPTKIVIPGLKDLTVVDKSEIIYCEGSNNYTDIFLDNGSRLDSSKTLLEYEKLLEGDGFYRIHRKTLINLEHVKKYRKGKGGSVIMDNKTELEVATRRKEGFLKALNNL